MIGQFITARRNDLPIGIVPDIFSADPETFAKSGYEPTTEVRRNRRPGQHNDENDMIDAIVDRGTSMEKLSGRTVAWQ